MKPTTLLPSLASLLPLLAAAAEPDVAADAGAAPTAQFDVLEYRVLGNSLLGNEAIERAVYPHLGEGRTIADVEAARTALEEAYRAAGYATVFVDIPEQEAGQGIVRLQVTEGRLDRVRVTGARYFSNRHIRAALPSLAPGQTPNLPQLQAELAEVNRATPDRVVTPVLKPGAAPGSVEIELKVADTLPLHGSLESNNRYTADTSKLRLNASLTYANLFQKQHSLTVQYQTAPQNRDNLEALVGTYVMPLAAGGRTALALYAVDSNTDVAALGTLSVLGNGQIFGAKFIHMLPDGLDFTQSLSWGVEYKDFLENILLDTDTSLQTPIRYLNWNGAYTATMRHEGVTTSFNVGVGFGIRGLVNDSSEFADKRYLGKPNYFLVRAGLQQAIDLPWQMQIGVRLGAQYTPGPLVSNEQYIVGGVDTVRGYLESGQLGDYGANGTLELRYTGLSALLGLPRSAAQLYGFYDGAVVVTHYPLPGQADNYRLGSFGVGMRLADWHGLSFALDWAHLLSRPGATPLPWSRTHFSFRYSF